MLGDRMSLGVTVYGNGGMNTDYASGQTDVGICTTGVPSGVRGANLLCGPGRLGVDLMQLVIAPTLALKINKDNAVGVSPLVAYQRFKAEGLQAFAQLSTSPGKLTDRGYDNSTGWGVRIGWQGRLAETVSVGASYASKMRMAKFDKYKGLFAEQGGFDLPENWNIGIAVKATPRLTLAADYQAINYGGVSSIANSSQQPGCTPTPAGGPGVGSGCLGGASGIGFGWRDVGVWKLGGEYQVNDSLIVRAGYNHTDNPIEARDVTFNILAPGVVRDHATLGFSYAVNKDTDLTLAYMHAFRKAVTEAPNAVYFPVGGSEKIEMYENSLGIAFSRKL